MKASGEASISFRRSCNLTLYKLWRASNEAYKKSFRRSYGLLQAKLKYSSLQSYEELQVKLIRKASGEANI